MSATKRTDVEHASDGDRFQEDLERRYQSGDIVSHASRAIDDEDDLRFLCFQIEFGDLWRVLGAIDHCLITSRVITSVVIRAR